MLEFVALLVGVTFIVQGIVLFKRTNNIISKSVLFNGKIIELKKRRIIVGSGIVSFIPIIKHVEGDGTVKIFESNSGFREGKYSLGDHIEFWYNPNDDGTKVIINNWLTKWIGVIISFIGIVSIIIWGLVFFYK
ncbi:MAG: hypothetical protein ACQEWV_32400 [Bacillota bacterium]